MKIRNEASFPIVVVGYASPVGYGEDVIIDPGDIGLIHGPVIIYLNEEPILAIIPGSMVCHDEEKRIDGYCVSKGTQTIINFSNKPYSLIIRHIDDAPHRLVREWRQSNDVFKILHKDSH